MCMQFQNIFFFHFPVKYLWIKIQFSLYPYTHDKHIKNEYTREEKKNPLSSAKTKKIFRYSRKEAHFLVLYFSE